uniref:Dynein heavy chain 10, axonemal n=1 Tax=Cacopsylla melanoneura TaxID=428564 RepID=A0A8D8Q9X9_9HEMI
MGRPVSLTGPHGTGKSETVKGLAKAMGIMCLQISCTEDTSLTGLDKLLVGVIQSGVWALFDQFRTMDTSILSLLSTKLIDFRNKLLQQVPRSQIVVEGVNLPVLRMQSISVQTNPL